MTGTSRTRKRPWAKLPGRSAASIAATASGHLIHEALSQMSRASAKTDPFAGRMRRDRRQRDAAGEVALRGLDELAAPESLCQAREDPGPARAAPPARRVEPVEEENGEGQRNHGEREVESAHRDQLDRDRHPLPGDALDRLLARDVAGRDALDRRRDRLADHPVVRGDARTGRRYGRFVPAFVGKPSAASAEAGQVERQLHEKKEEDEEPEDEAAAPAQARRHVEEHGERGDRGDRRKGQEQDTGPTNATGENGPTP